MKKFVLGLLVSTLVIAALLSAVILLGGCAPVDNAENRSAEILKPSVENLADYAAPYHLVSVGSVSNLGSAAEVYILVYDVKPGNTVWTTEAVIVVSSDGVAISTK